MPQIAILRTDPSCPPACDGWKVVTEWSELGSRDIDGKAGRPSKRARTSQYDSAGNLHARNIYGPGPDEILMRGDWSYGWFFYHADKQGSITALVAGDGSVVEKYSYDAFGRPTILSANNTQLSTSAVGNRFMFTGREWLADLQLYDYRHRLYNPDNGRFLQSDPTGFDAGDMNLFRYCDDDPVDKSDPAGLSDVSYIPTWDWSTTRDVDGRPILANVIVASAHGGATYATNSTLTRHALGMSRLGRAEIPESMRLPVSQLKTDIKKLDKYTPTIPIRLEMCHAGDVKAAALKADLCYAQKVANAFRTNPIWANPGDVDPATGQGKTDPYMLFTANKTVSPTGPIEDPGAGPCLGVRSATSGASGRRVFDAYGSSSPTAAAWEASYGLGGWLGTERNLGR